MPIYTLEAERFSALGDTPLRLVDLGRGVDPEQTAAITIGLDQAGALPPVDPTRFDVLLTTAASSRRPWVSVPSARWHARVAQVVDAIEQKPIAASVGIDVLRRTETMSFSDALAVESFAYSTLLGGAEFRTWHALQPPRALAAPIADPIAVERHGDHVTIRLDRAATRNAVDAAMRDALFAALAAVLDDPTAPTVELSGTGACFSIGGDLAEFGRATDLARAHVIRTTRSAAALLDRLGHRTKVVVQGAAIGSGLEIAAAAARRVARANAFFQLPELRMGLIPGAGGTVSVPRAIGRHRTAYLFLSGRRLDARTALTWGFIHAIEPASE